MSDVPYARVKQVLEAVRDLAPDARDAHLQKLCGDDDALRREVDELLDHGDRPHAQLEPAPVLRDVIDGLDRTPGATPDALLPGARLGPFTLGARLGSGGMGVVFAAEQDDPPRRVALKLLHGLTLSDEILARFRREARLLARLDHPGIATLHDSGTLETEAGPRPYLTMSLAEGVPLTRHVRDARLGADAIVELVARVADAVGHAHDQGIVHRDLKGANVLVDRDGNPTVLDFGVARLVAGAAPLTSLHTATGQLVGTLACMSPEQLDERGAVVDARSDVYALGALLFEALTGQPPVPIAGLTVPAAALAIRTREPQRLRDLDERLSVDLDIVVDTALAKEPERRYADASAFAADLRRVLAGQRITARPLSGPAQLLRLMRRHKALAAGLLVALLSLTVALIVSLDRNAVMEQARELAQREADRAHVAAAAAALDAGQPLEAERQLDAVSDAGRTWEWRHFQQRLDSAEHVVDLGDPVLDVVLLADGGSLSLTVSGELVRTSPTDGRVVERRALPGPPPSMARFTRGGAEFVGVDVTGGRLQHWNTARLEATGSLDLAGDEGAVQLLAVSSNGTRAAAATDASVHLWNLGTGESERINRRRDIQAVAITDTQLLLSRQFGSVVVRDLDEPGEVRFAERLSGQSLPAMVASPDGTRLAVGTAETTIVVVSLPELEPVAEFIGHTAHPDVLAWSGDGRRLISHAPDRTLRTWELSSGRAVDIRTATEATGLACDGTGSRVVGVADGTVRTWDLSRPTHGEILTGHESYVYGLSGLGDTLLSGSWDGSVRVWDVRAGRLERIHDLGDRVTALAIADDGQRFATRSKDTVRVGQVFGPDEPIAVADDAWPASALLWLDERTVLVGSSRRAPARAVDVRTREVLHTLESGEHYLRCLARSPDGTRFASGSTAGSVDVWTRANWTVERSLEPRGEAVNAVAFAPDGQTLASAFEDGVVQLHDVSDGALLRELPRHPGEVWSLAWSPDGRRLATGCHDGIVRLFDPRDGAQVVQLRGHRDYVKALTFLADGDILASGSGDGDVRTWQTATRRERLGRPAD